MMRRLALVLVALGGLIVVASLALLNYIDLGNGPQKLWDISHRSFLIFSILAVLAGIFGLIAIFRDAWLLPILATGAGFFLLGEFLPTSGGYSVYKAGLWGALAGSVIMAVAGVIALVGLRRELVPDGLGAGAAASPGTAMRELATDSPPATRDPVPVAVEALVPAGHAPRPSSEPQRPPAGWYPDPGGEAPERYWSGREWTKELR